MSSFLRFTIGVFASVVLFPFLSLAQNLEPDSLAKNLELPSVLIQATRAAHSSPVPHTNLSAEKMAQQSHAQDVPYLLSAVPSLVESSDAGTGTGYTGLRIRGSDPTRVNVTLNGIPLNDAESQGVYWVDLPDVAASASEIQVQRGVGTSTNGAGAFGASINLDLSKVESERYAILSNTLGAFNTRKHSLQLGTGLLGGKLAFTARVSGVYSDGYVDRARVNMNAIHLSGTYLDDRQSLQLHLLSGHEITYQAWNGLPAQYYDGDSLRTYNTAGTERPGSPYPDEVDDYTQRHYLAHYKRILTQGLQVQLNGHYTRGYGFYEQYKAAQNLQDYGLGFDTLLLPMDLVRRRWLDNDFYGSTFSLRWTPEGQWNPKILLGGAWSHYLGKHYGTILWTQSYTGAPKDFRYYDNDADKQDANTFVKIEVAPSKRFSAFLDLQLRSVRYRFIGYDQELNNVQQSARLNFFNPKVGASYSWSDNCSAYTYLGVGHREPNRDDYTQSSPSSRPKAEQMLDLETGVRREGEQWSASANFFWMRYRDQLVLDGRINDVGAYIRTNVPDSWRTGLELEAKGKVGSFLQLAGNAAWSQNKIRTFTEYRDNWDTGAQEAIVFHHSDLAFSPSLIARGEASVRLHPVKNKERYTLYATLIGKYVSRQFLDNTSNEQTSLPAYFVNDLRLNLDLNEIIGKKASLIFSILNLTDQKYASNGWAYRYVSANYDARPYDAYTRLEGGNVYHQAGYFPQAGRHWMATLRLEF